MTAVQRQINTSEYSIEELDRIAYAIAPFLSRYSQPDQPLREKEAAAFMGISQRQFKRFVQGGKIKAHKLMDNTRDFYLRSEIIDAIKKS